MKILVLFIDMVRVTELNLIDKNKPEKLLDNTLKNIGGTLFTRCYSPGPDSPRSGACMQSGLYPYFNGCDTRIKWPRYFMKENLKTIFDHAYEKGFEVNACIRKETYEIGPIRYQPSTKIHVYHSYDDFFSRPDSDVNMFDFVYNPDWHISVGDYRSTTKAFRKGDKLIDLFFKKYLTLQQIERYDYALIYSDHGFQYRDEAYKMSNILELLNNGRSQLLMFIHKKGDKGITKDNRLASMVDLYASLEHLIGGKEYRQGYSLFDQQQRKILHIEDHQDFKVYPEVMIKQWRVITEDYDIRTDIYHTIDADGRECDLKIIDNYLREFSPKYSEYVKQLEVWKKYAIVTKEENRFFAVGEKRESKFVLYCLAIFYKIKILLFSRFYKILKFIQK